MKVDPNTKLEDLDPNLFKQLEDSLQKDDSWKKIASTLVELKRLSNRKFLEWSRCGDPATQLLDDFKCKLYKVKHLKALLQHCQLYDVLAIIAEPTPLKIIRQPSSYLEGNKITKVRIGNSFSLQFEVVGIPPPKYVWCLNGSEIPGKYSSQLNCDNYDRSLEGVYTCIASQYVRDCKVGEVFSEAILIETQAEAPVIMRKPDTHISLFEGSPILLKVKANGYPPPTYEWVHENEVLTTETNNTFYRAKSTKADGGIYKCYVKNRAGTQIIETNVVIYVEKETPLYSGVVTQKIALLIANDDYLHNDRLLTPINDVAELAVIFQKLGFQTLCFLNLNLDEMKVAVYIFGALIKNGAFVVFYFAGHGFSAGDAFMLPVDCPSYKDCTHKDCYRESMFLNVIMEKEPTLCIVFLDMCLRQINVKEYALLPYKTNRNLIRAYATTNHKASYEKPKELNSIYVIALKKNLSKKMPILAILNLVNAEIRQLYPEQMPMVAFITADNFLLDQQINAVPSENTNLSVFDIEVKCDVFTLKKLKDVFNNIFKLQILCEFLDYKINTEHVKQDGGDNRIFIIPNIQKLEDNLKIEIKLKNGEIKEYSIPTSKFSNFFKNI